MHSLARSGFSVAGDRNSEARVIENEGFAFFRLGKLQAAEDRFRLALSTWLELNDGKTAIATRTRLGTVCFVAGNTLEAISQFEQAMKDAKEIDPGNPFIE